MKRAIIFASQKGGLGKSTTARAFVDLARRAGRRVAAWDLDFGTGSLAMVYKDRDPEVGCAAEDVRDENAEGAWLNSFHGEADDVVLDVPGGAMFELLRINTRGAVALAEEVKRSGREMVVVSVIGTQRDSTATPLVAIDEFGSTVHHVVVKNGFFGGEDEFVVYEGFDDPATGERRYGKIAEKVRELGGQVVFLPKLHAKAVTLLDVNSMTFAEGAESVAKLGRRQSWITREWLTDVEARFNGSWLSANGEVVVGAGGEHAALSAGVRKGRRGGQQLSAV